MSFADAVKPPTWILKRLMLALSLALSFRAFFQHVLAQPLPAQAPKQINEQMFVQIGGIDQWITIQGDDRNTPAVLFLHGGPGDAMSPFAESMFAGWEKDFVLVQWDQRGAGRTYNKNGPSIEPSLTVQRMADDGIEVAQFLANQLNKQKIVILGLSWGSILGIHMAHARPDLFYAYIGLAQLVNTRREEAASYACVLELARAADDQAAVTALRKIGPPPWNSLFPNWPIFRKWKLAYQAKKVTAPAAPFALSPAYASPQEKEQYDAADDFSFAHFWGLKMTGPMEQVDLPALGSDFAVPIFILQGEEDLTAVPELAKSYFDSIKAPRKQFYLVPGTGHEPSASQLDLTLKILTEQVRPLISP
jgi:pimeloyl-ACP methyl ester carboxylesterase